jgi:diacylglycerol kinase (ATP)
MAYNLAVIDVLFHRIGCKLRVVMDTPNGEEVREGDFLFSLAASGQYYGGGYHAAPLSAPDDGLLDFILIRKVGKLKILGFLKKYRAGAHLDLDICEHLRGTRMRVYCDKPTPVTADGECFADTKIAFELVKNAFNFVVPKHLAKQPATV